METNKDIQIKDFQEEQDEESKVKVEWFFGENPLYKKINKEE